MARKTKGSGAAGTHKAITGPPTLGNALNTVLRGQARRIDVDFIDADGQHYNASVYRCQNALVRADFKGPIVNQG